MSTAIDYPQSTEKIVELLEAMQREQARAESRREASEREQFQLLEQLQQELGRLAAAGGSASPAAPAANPGRKAASGTAATVGRELPSEALSEWEREKARLLQQWTQNEQNPSLDSSDLQATLSPADSATADSPATQFPTGSDWLNYLEHLDPDDPALHDDELRRQLVGRLRRIEVELSLERAQLARMRTELESQMIEFNHDQRILETKQQAASSREGRSPWRFARMFGSK